jgi:predicted MFS family arabinose efflux permease
MATTGIQDLLKYFVVYNVLAFLTQPFTGMLADGAKQRHWLLLSSIILLILAVLETVCVMPYCSAESMVLLMVLSVLLGIGNSLFHVWGGKETAVRTGNDIRALGVFVSTGAFGLAVGSVFLSRALMLCLLLGICILALAFLRIDTTKQIDAIEVDSDSKVYSKPLVWALLILIMLIVAGRSFLGESFTGVIDKTPMVVLLIGALTMMGKMAGGWLVKWMGMVTSIILLVAGVIICLVAKGNHIGIALAGLFMLNCTMPITLYWANVMLKGHEGLAFGLLAASLIPGYLIATLL